MIRGVERNEDLVRLMQDILMDLILIQIRLAEGQLFKWNEWIYIQQQIYYYGNAYIGGFALMECIHWQICLNGMHTLVDSP